MSVFQDTTIVRSVNDQVTSASRPALRGVRLEERSASPRLRLEAIDPSSFQTARSLRSLDYRDPGFAAGAFLAFLAFPAFLAFRLSAFRASRR
ncbi:MAG: hypothetical protein ACLFVT_06725 [Syntrophobacteria bacterium]